MVTGSIPPTGLPLPFISAGSTSLLVFMSTNEKNNTDLEDYKTELRLGKYRNTERIKNTFINSGYK